MSADLSRRRFLHASVSAAALAGLAPARALARRSETVRLGAPASFSFDALVERARGRAGGPYEEPSRPAPDIVSRIDYEAHGQLRFDPDRALHAEGPGAYPVTFFHLGRFFPKSVRMFALEGGEAREIVYSSDDFEMPSDNPARDMPADAGFAGFRFQEARSREDWPTQDWVAFLGASYFRAIGALGQYGLSARGLAVDTATQGEEEFPDFVEFYIDVAGEAGAPNRVYALLDGPSVCGAYAFEIVRTQGAVMEIDARVFVRADVERLGVAPLTSMFWYGEHNRPEGVDWRPEVHDSDGLALWTGSGERLWRALNNPGRVVVSSFQDRSPKGFGLLQRDRDVENYLDGVNYDLRPSLWVEPLGDWGPGAVQLVELPTDDEIHDNIAVFWVPEASAEAGREYAFRYRLHWLEDEPYRERSLARVAATRMGRGGEPGQPRPEDETKFVVEFEGGPLMALGEEAAPDVAVDASRGRVVRAFVEKVPRTPRWRATFDLVLDNDGEGGPDAADGPAGREPAVELRAFLRRGERPLSETWLFQYEPAAPA